MKPLVSAELSCPERWIAIGGLKESHEVEWSKLDVKLYLLLVVLARNFFVYRENFVQEEVHGMLHVLPLLICRL